jgi:hypothetical protein
MYKKQNPESYNMMYHKHKPITMMFHKHTPTKNNIKNEEAERAKQSLEKTK